VKEDDGEIGRGNKRRRKKKHCERRVEMYVMA
jgi:hypothetical protein